MSHCVCCGRLLHALYNRGVNGRMMAVVCCLCLRSVSLLSLAVNITTGSQNMQRQSSSVYVVGRCTSLLVRFWESEKKKTLNTTPRPPLLMPSSLPISSLSGAAKAALHAVQHQQRHHAVRLPLVVQLSASVATVSNGANRCYKAVELRASCR
jgi:hypothetical protein